MFQRQVNEQHQEQKIKQTIGISQQQLLQSRLIEAPLNQFMEQVKMEMEDNPALEVTANDGEEEQFDGKDDSENLSDFEREREREERQTALDDALDRIWTDDDELPVFQRDRNVSNEHTIDRVYGQAVTFYDVLKQQMGETNLTFRQGEIMEYLICSLDDDGLLRKTIDTITDELAIYQGIDASEKEVENTLTILQSFDPAGIAARDLRECLLLQIARCKSSNLTLLMQRVVSECFEDFIKKRWDRIGEVLSIDDEKRDKVIAELRKLNPKPGASISEIQGKELQHIIPDFIVDTDDNGNITFMLNTTDVPELQVSQSFVDLVKQYKDNKCGMSSQMKENLLYSKRKIEAAQGFIEAMKVRKRTFTLTIKAIIDWQHKFLEDGDDTSLRPMILKDIAEKTGLDISTISRVCNGKYVRTRWGTFPLRYFFGEASVKENGEEISTRAIKMVLQSLIDSEDKREPLGDEQLRLQLASQGYFIARRTVAKYREQMGIPVAKLRKVFEI